MLVTMLFALLSQQPNHGTCQMASTQAGWTMACRGPKSVKANNWWDRRPSNHLFAKDETEPFIQQVLKPSL